MTTLTLLLLYLKAAMKHLMDLILATKMSMMQHLKFWRMKMMSLLLVGFAREIPKWVSVAGKWNMWNKLEDIHHNEEMMTQMRRMMMMMQ
jgi:hypothetical protein